MHSPSSPGASKQHPNLSYFIIQSNNENMRQLFMTVVAVEQLQVKPLSTNLDRPGQPALDFLSLS